jgi:mRNA-degrading endonuclease toxin of MazEF toxin-antitoxin module
VELRAGIRGEQTSKHNALVVSSPGIQRSSRTVIIAPITSTHRDVPWLVQVDPEDAGIDRRSWIECDQLQALAPSPERFETYRGRLAESRRPLVAVALQHVFDGALSDVV